MNKIKIGIVGGSGWTGVELLRLLLQHNQVDITIITSRSLAGKPISVLFPNLLGQTDLCFSQPDVKSLLDCDVVFFATPHGVAMDMAPKLLDQGVRIIDLGADFRLQDIEVWQTYYQMIHTQKEWVKQAVYGLPEYNKEAIKTAQLVANPGCYPTAISLALKPLLASHFISVTDIIADCKSGVSGAGRVVNTATSLCEASETLKAYGVAGHRHLPEIKQTLTSMTGLNVGLTFIPHLVPMIRGMLATIYVNLVQAKSQDEIQNLFEQHYQNEPFVQILPSGVLPETRFVKASNHCQLGFGVLNNNKQLVVISAIDNLIKGASGQAIQNMNIMFNLPETQGLPTMGIMP